MLAEAGLTQLTLNRRCRGGSSDLQHRAGKAILKLFERLQSAHDKGEQAPGIDDFLPWISSREMRAQPKKSKFN